MNKNVKLQNQPCCVVDIRIKVFFAKCVNRFTALGNRCSTLCKHKLNISKHSINTIKCDKLINIKMSAGFDQCKIRWVKLKHSGCWEQSEGCSLVQHQTTTEEIV